MNYRTRIEIISQILEIANGENATRTRIMYKAFLSYVQLKDYLKILTENDLLEYDSKSRTFKTTEIGLGFLKTYDQLDDIIKKEQKDKNNSGHRKDSSDSKS
jgi:predicted transcriptional regulator